MSKVISDKFGIYLGETAEATELARVGVNSETLNVNLNPTETEYADVTQATKQTDLESYKLTVEGSAKFDKDDPAHKVFFQFYRSNKVLDEAKLPMCFVYMFEDGAENADMYEGTTVVLNSITLNGAGALEVSFKLSTNVPPKKGSATLTNNNKTANFKAAGGE